MSEEDLFWWAEHVHSGDPETSASAAEAAGRVAGVQMRLVFEFLLKRPMTQDQLREETGLGDNAAKRCSDLHNYGWIRDSGKRGISNRGRPAVLWEVTERGRELYQALTTFAPF